jgi:hypothetical protein
MHGWRRCRETEETEKGNGRRNSHTAAPFYRRTRIEELGEKHPGLCEFVEQAQHRRIL